MNTYLIPSGDDTVHAHPLGLYAPDDAYLDSARVYEPDTEWLTPLQIVVLSENVEVMGYACLSGDNLYVDENLMPLAIEPNTRIHILTELEKQPVRSPYFPKEN